MAHNPTEEEWLLNGYKPKSGDAFEDPSERQNNLPGLNYWRLCEELSVFQAALLIVGVDPSGEDGAYCENWDLPKRPCGYEAAKTAISNALRSGAIKGRLIPIFDRHEEIENTINIVESRVEVASLRAWLASRGEKPSFFFPAMNNAPDSNNTPDYLDSGNPRYAPKLAAAIRAWQAVTDPGSKPPKQALMKWLREHAAEFGLTDDGGKPNETGIEEAAKMANWRPGGGAPKTPGG